MGYKNDKPHKEYNEGLELLADNLDDSPYFFSSVPRTNNSAKRVFAFSNENLSQMLRDFDFKGKKVLTVGSSGDQMFEAVLRGASEVTIIDANPMTQPFVELKMAGIETFEMEDFYEYMTREKIFDPHMYRKVSHLLSDRAKEFWDSIMLDIDHSDIGVNMKATAAFAQTGFSSKGKDFCSYFESKANYDRLRRYLKRCKINFIQAELSDFEKVLKDNKYDYILLSNIEDYVDVDEFFANMTKLGHKNLNKNGVMQVYYVFQNNEGFLDSFLMVFQSYFGTRSHSKFLDIKNVDGVYIDKEFSKEFLKDKASAIFMRKEAFDRIPENFESAPYSEL
ncbi:MAG: DUF3419 family protein [Clostridia bacterium]|nr:DUF3419 family protein [Clostridia bacterium]